MTESIDYTILMNKIKKLEELNKEYAKIGNSIFILDEFKCFSSNIIKLLQQDIANVKELVIFYKKKADLYVINNDNPQLDDLDNYLKIIDKTDTDKKLIHAQFSKEIITWLKTTDFFTSIINDKVKIPEDEFNKIKKLKENELQNSKVFSWRTNQLDAFNRLDKNGLETGIHCQATGTGKSYIILHYIEYMKKIKTNPKIILFTERINILVDLFHFKKGVMKQDKKCLIILKEKGICDITDFNIINRVTNKKKDWDIVLKDSNSPTLLVINRAFLTSDNILNNTLNNHKKKYENIKKDDIDLILHDECHNTTSTQCHDFLQYMKNINVPIVGFSATPLRTGKGDKDKLLEIYDDPKDKSLLNLLTNYNMIYSIQQKLILPPEFFWYMIESTKKNKQKDIELVSQEEIGSVLELLNQIIPSLPNKKLVAWCGTIQLANKWKELFEKNYKQRKNMKDFTFGVDTSVSATNDYDKFKESNGNSILFCAQKHREGSDIRLLDGCIFLDKVKDRGAIPFIQSIGRVLRLCKETPNKTKGIVIDGYVKDDNEYEKIFIDKIIGYYIVLLNLTNVDSDMNEKPILDRYIQLLDIIKFDKVKELVEIKFGDINIRINCNKLNWDEIICKFEPILQHKIQLSEKDMFDIIIIKLKNLNIFNSTTNFWEVYNNMNKTLIGLPNDLYEKYKSEFDSRTIYDILNIDMSNYYATVGECIIGINKLYKGNIDDIIYKELLSKDNRLPLFPEELYKKKGFTCIKNSFNKSSSKKIDF